MKYILLFCTVITLQTELLAESRRNNIEENAITDCVCDLPSWFKAFITLDDGTTMPYDRVTKSSCGVTGNECNGGCSIKTGGGQTESCGCKIAGASTPIPKADHPDLQTLSKIPLSQGN